MGDVDAVVTLIDEAVTWLAHSGSDQWQHPSSPNRHRVLSDILTGATSVVTKDQDILGTIIVNEIADPEFWTPADKPELALYLHRMVVARVAKGLNLGSSMLDWAGRIARLNQKPLIRLDAWSTNLELHRYYKSQGFREIRILRYGHRGSGACFERDAAYQHGSGPTLHCINK